MPGVCFNRFIHRISSVSNGGFGIHSPFVFDFVVNVLNEQNAYYAYDNIEKMTDDNGEKHYLKFLYRVLNYYRYRRVLLVGNSPNVEKLLRFCPEIQVYKVDNLQSANFDKSYDLIYFSPNTFLNSVLDVLQDITIWIDGICGDSRIWSLIKANEKMRISIDFFDFGIIFAKNKFQKQFYKLTLKKDI